MTAIVFVNAVMEGESGEPLIALRSLAGVSLLTRHVRSLKSCGVTSIVFITPQDVEIQKRISDQLKKPFQLEATITGDGDLAALELDPMQEVLVIAGDHIVDASLIERMLNESSDSLLIDKGQDDGGGMAPW